MGVLLTTYESRGDVEPAVGIAMQVRARTVAAAEGCDALVMTGVMATGAWL
jgi:hypothetical protein